MLGAVVKRRMLRAGSRGFRKEGASFGLCTGEHERPCSSLQLL